MKKVEVEKTVSKMMIISAAILCIMLGAWLINQGYCNNYNPSLILAMPKIVSGISIFLVALAIAFVVLALKKKVKSFELATWFAALATFTMLLNVNYSVKALEFSMFNHILKFYQTSLIALCVAIVLGWAYAIYRIIKY